MRRFAELYTSLDGSTATSSKLAALMAYLAAAPPDDAAWALWFLSGRKLARVVAAPRLREWTAAALDLPLAVVEESYAHVGDLAETLALLWDLPATDRKIAAAETGDDRLAVWAERLIALRGAEEAIQREAFSAWWRALPLRERFLLNKLAMGSMRVGVSSGLAGRAVAQHAGLPEGLVMQRLMGDWQPSAAFFERLIAAPAAGDVADIGAPYPFYLASPLDDAPVGDGAELPQALGAVDDFLVEWKWDGIRAQVIRRAGQTFVWSRGEELMNGRFPEVEALAAHWPDGTVVDGEILAWRDDAVAPFALLQRRIGRKKVGAKLLADAPVTLLVYDLLEWTGADWRSRPLRERRAQLEALGQQFPGLRLSPRIVAADWSALALLREDARARSVEGLMLKQLDSPYLAGRKRGAWWKWKIGAMTVDCILVYAQAGHGRRANLYTDYTLAVWDGEGESRKLVPVAKAYSGLTDAELVEMDRWIRRHTREKFGPVRSVDAGEEEGQVFEIAFEGIQASPRHKSGVALRFPRIARWRKDKKPAEADRLETLKTLIAGT
jgi:DNA ligase-1